VEGAEGATVGAERNGVVWVSEAMMDVPSGE